MGVRFFFKKRAVKGWKAKEAFVFMRHYQFNNHSKLKWHLKEIHWRHFELLSLSCVTKTNKIRFRLSGTYCWLLDGDKMKWLTFIYRRCHASWRIPHSPCRLSQGQESIKQQHERKGNLTGIPHSHELRQNPRFVYI